MLIHLEVVRNCSFFVTYAGSQLTFMTQNEKVLIFRYSRGVKTDLHDTEWESAHFSLLTRGHNWPFRCLDKVGHATFGQDNVAKLVIVMSVNIMLVRIMLVLKYWSGWNWQSWSWPRCRRKEGKSGVALLPFCCFCFSFCCLLEHFCRFCILAQLHHLDLVQPSWAGTTLA